MKKLLLFLSLANLAILYGCSGDAAKTGDGAASGADTTASNEATGTDAASGAETMALIETDYGNIKVKLYNTTPKHRDNFIKLAKEGYFDGTLFHRIIPGFMIQGGDPDSKTAQPGQQLGAGGPGYTIEEEIGAKHFKGALAAARQGDQVNPEKRSSGSQFYIVQNGPVPAAQLDQIVAQRGLVYSQAEREHYINVGGTPFLDGDYTVFGQVVEGLDVVDKIATAERAPGDRPLKDIKMKVKIL